MKKYLGSFTFELKVKHSFEFYKLIGDEENAFIIGEKDKYAGKEEQKKVNLLVEQKENNVIGIGGGSKNKKKLKQPKMKIS